MTRPEPISIARRRDADCRSGDTGAARLSLLAALLIVTLAGLAGWIGLQPFSRPPVESPPALRLALQPPADLTVGAGSAYPFGLALAPDGRRLVFPAARSGPVQLWLHDLTTGDAQVLPATDEAVLPFWGPDGRTIGFFAGGRLRVLLLDDGRVEDLGEAPSPQGGVWHPAGDLIFAPRADAGLSRRRAADGIVEPWTTVDAAAGELAHRHPALLGDGRHAIFYVHASQPTRTGLWIAPLDDPSARRRLTGSDAHAVIVADAVVYSSGGALVAQRLDEDRRRLSGPAVLLGPAVGHGPQNQLFATAAADVLIFAAPASGLRELRWLDRAGVAAGTIGEAMNAWDVRLSPAADRVAVARLDPQLSTLDIWTYDGERPIPRRISPAIDADETPVWSGRGTRLAWVTGRRAVTVRGAEAVLPDENLYTFTHPIRLTDWSADDRWIVVTGSRPETRDDVILLPSDGGEPRIFAQSPFNEIQGTISPDGRWLAYASDESGRFEIYVDTLPTPGTRGRVTAGGGSDPRWHQNGGELYFRRGSEVHVVTLSMASGRPEATSSERLFDVAGDVRAYDAAADGRRFVVNVPAAGTTPLTLTVLVHPRKLLGSPAP